MTSSTPAGPDAPPVTDIPGVEMAPGWLHHATEAFEAAGVSSRSAATARVDGMAALQANARQITGLRATADVLASAALTVAGPYVTATAHPGTPETHATWFLDVDYPEQVSRIDAAVDVIRGFGGKWTEHHRPGAVDFHQHRGKVRLCVSLPPADAQALIASGRVRGLVDATEDVTP